MKKILLILFVIFSLLFLYFIREPKEEKRVIKFSSWGSQSETVVLKELIRRYEEKNNNIKIEFIHIPQNYFQKIQLLFASNLEPDVVFFNNQNIQMYINAGLIEDLTPFLKPEEFFEESLNCFKADSKIYAIPRDISTLVIYYNKDIIKTVPKHIKDIYKLKDFALNHTNKNHFGINFEEDLLFWSYYLASNGGGVISDDRTKLIINSENSRKALELYSDIVNKYHAAPNKSQIGSLTTAQMFINGQLAMYLGGRWMVPKFREAINFDWDIMEFPVNSDNKVYLDASGWAVSKKSRNKKIAIDFIKFLSESSDELASTGLIIPARKESAKKLIETDRNKKPQNSQIFVDMIKNTKPTPVNENYSVINDILKEQAQSIFAGNKKIDEALDSKTIEKLESLL